MAANFFQDEVLRIFQNGLLSGQFHVKFGVVLFASVQKWHNDASSRLQVKL